MNYRISKPNKALTGTINLTASKSESNRVLIIKVLCEEKFKIENLATAEDTTVLNEILKTKISNQQTHLFDVGAAGTTMRFLTTYFSTQEGTFILTGSERMKKRPIAILVNALRELGANIEYLEEDGFPPLKITGQKLKGGTIEIDGNISSQYISALLMISTELQNGLVIKFKGEIVSRPYINMTLKMMQEFRVYGQWQKNSISVSKQNYHVKSETDYAYKVEADWSSASYWYAIATLCDEVDFYIEGLKYRNLQGDAMVADIFSFFGIKTKYTQNGIHLSKIKAKKEHFGFDFSDCPDLVQTVAVVVSALKIPSLFNGIRTLKIKETDRVLALKNELKKLGAELEIITDDSIKIIPATELKTPKLISTYKDHRMAMAFASLAVMFNNIEIEDVDVVKKSYPNFWNDLKSVGFVLEEI